MTGTAPMLTIRIPLKVRKRGGRKTMIAPDVLAMPARVDVALVKALARAFRWRRMLEDGSYSTIKELAAAEKINASYLCRVLRLTLLAPDVVEAILDGRQAEGMTLPRLMEGVVVEWKTPQRAAVATITNPASDSSRQIRLDCLPDWPEPHRP